MKLIRQALWMERRRKEMGERPAGPILSMARSRRVPHVYWGTHTWTRHVPMVITWPLGHLWNRLACWLDGHDEILWRERIDPDDDGSFHCPSCCAVLGRDEARAKPAGTAGVATYTTTDSTALPRKDEP